MRSRRAWRRRAALPILLVLGVALLMNPLIGAGIDPFTVQGHESGVPQGSSGLGAAQTCAQYPGIAHNASYSGGSSANVAFSTTAGDRLMVVGMGMQTYPNGPSVLVLSASVDAFGPVAYRSYAIGTNYYVNMTVWTGIASATGSETFGVSNAASSLYNTIAVYEIAHGAAIDVGPVTDTLTSSLSLSTTGGGCDLLIASYGIVDGLGSGNVPTGPAGWNSVVGSEWATVLYTGGNNTTAAAAGSDTATYTNLPTNAYTGTVGVLVAVDLAGPSPFVAVGGGAGTFVISTTAGDTLIVFEWDSVTVPSDTASNVWNEVFQDPSQVWSVWNATAASTGADTIKFNTGDPSFWGGWGVDVTSGRTLAHGVCASPCRSVDPPTLGADSVALFTLPSENSAATSGGSAWEFYDGLVSDPPAFYSTALTQNVSAGASPELSANATTANWDFGWMEIPSQVPPAPGPVTDLKVVRDGQTTANLTWDNPGGSITNVTVSAWQQLNGYVCGSTAFLGSVSVGTVVDKYEWTGLGLFYPACYSVQLWNGVSASSLAWVNESFPAPPTDPVYSVGPWYENVTYTLNPDPVVNYAGYELDVYQGPPSLGCQGDSLYTGAYAGYLVYGSPSTPWLNATGLHPETQYCSVLYDYNYSGTFNGVGNYTNATSVWVFNFTTPAELLPIAAPVGLHVYAVGDSEIDMWWNYTAWDLGSVQAYYIYEYLAGCSVLNNFWTTGGGSPQNFQDTGLAASTTYCYEVTAVNYVGEGPPSAEASATTHAAPPVPDPVTDLRVVRIGAYWANLSWVNSTNAPITQVLVLGWQQDQYCSGPPDWNFGAGPSATYFNTSGTGFPFPWQSGCWAVQLLDYDSSSALTFVNETLEPPPTDVTTTSATGVAWTNISWTPPATSQKVEGYAVQVYEGTPSSAWCGGSSYVTTYVTGAYQTGGLPPIYTYYNDTIYTPGRSYCALLTTYNWSGEEWEQSDEATLCGTPGYDCALYMDEFNFTDGIAIQAPTDLAAVPTGPTGIGLTWTNPVGAVGDNVSVYSSACASLLETIATPGAVEAYAVTGLSPSTPYCFTVDASSRGGQGPWATPYANASTTSAPSPPSAPTILGAVAGGDWIGWYWINPRGPLVNDTLLLGTTCGSWTWRISVGVGTYHNSSGLLAHTSYCGAAEAWNATGASPASADVVAVTGSGGPAAPLNLTVTAQTSGSVSLSWRASGAGVTNYTVRYGVSCGSLSAIWAAGPSTNATVTGLSASTTYCFAVQAWVGTAGSAFSATVLGTTSGGGGGGGGGGGCENCGGVTLPGPTVRIGIGSASFSVSLSLLLIVVGAAVLIWAVVRRRKNKGWRL
jgi:hypothetical protein